MKRLIFIEVGKLRPKYICFTYSPLEISEWVYSVIFLIPSLFKHLFERGLYAITILWSREWARLRTFLLFSIHIFIIHPIYSGLFKILEK